MSIRKFAAPISRRKLIQGLGLTAAGLSLGGFSTTFSRSASAAERRTLRLAWGQSDVCQSPVSVALERGIFKKHNLNVEPINFSGSTDQLLQAIASGQADGAVGMTLRWLKPLEQGFDVNLTVGTHGGCMRLLTLQDSPINSAKDLKGKRVAVSDQASPIRNFFAIQAKKQGVDPESDIHWVQYTDDLAGEALKKGEVDAIAGDDPTAWLHRENYHLKQVGSNLDGEYAHRTCCVFGLNGKLVRDEPEIARAASLAIVEAQHWAAEHLEETGRIFAPHIPQNVTPEQVTAMLGEHTHQLAEMGDNLRADIEQYTRDLKAINVIRSTTDPKAFADYVVKDV